jgi:hypothetical protein
MAANPEVLAYLVEGAKRRGIDPATVVRAFGHEGLNVFDPAQPDRGGDEGSSFGPYQLHYAGMSKSMPRAGMGDDFTSKTGLNARDPSTWRQQTDFVLDHLAGGGSWRPWMGAAAEGITGRMGLPGGSGAPSPQADGPKGQEAYPAPVMGSMMASSSQPAQQQASSIPAAVQALANPRAAASNVFGMMAALPQQQAQFSPVQIMGPSPDQANALSSLIAALKGGVA